MSMCVQREHDSTSRHFSPPLVTLLPLTQSEARQSYGSTLSMPRATVQVVIDQEPNKANLPPLPTAPCWQTITVFKLNGGDVSRFCVEFYLEESSGYDGQFELAVSGVNEGAWVGGQGPLAMEGELFSGGEHSYRCWDLSSYSKADPAFTLTVKPLGDGKDALKLKDEVRGRREERGREGEGEGEL